MAITSFDKSNLKQIRADLSTALAAVEQKHGIRFEIGNIRFGEVQFRTKMEAYVVDNKYGVTAPFTSSGTVTGHPLVSVASQLEAAHGPGAAKARYYVAGAATPVQFVDYKPSRPKYPFVYVTARGTRYKCSEETMRRATRVG